MVGLTNCLIWSGGVWLRNPSGGHCWWWSGSVGREGVVPPRAWLTFTMPGRPLFLNQNIRSPLPPPLHLDNLSHRNDIWHWQPTGLGRSRRSLVEPRIVRVLIWCFALFLFSSLFFFSLSPSLIHLSYSISFFLVPVFNDARSTSHLIGPLLGKKGFYDNCFFMKKVK